MKTSASSGSQPGKHATLTLVKQIVGALIGIAVLGSLAYLAFVYIPARPSNIYAQGMRSVGRGIDHLLENDLLPHLSNVKNDATVTFSIEDNDILQLKLAGQADEDGNNLLTLSSNQGLKTDILFSNEADNRTLYIKPDPLFAEFLLQLFPTLASDASTIRSVSNQWWRFDNQLVSIVDQLSEPASSEPDVSEPAYDELVELTLQLLQKYVFTDKQSKMIFQLDEVLGEEDFDGRASYKYDVSIDRENMTIFLKQWRDQLIASQFVSEMDAQDALATWLRSSSYAGSLDHTTETTMSDMLQTLFSDTAIDTQVQRLIDDFQVTVWIDVENRLLRNIRLSTDRAGKPTHYDFGLRLEGKEIKLNLAYRAEPDASPVTTTPTSLTSALFADTTLVTRMDVSIDADAKEIDYDWQINLLDENQNQVLGMQLVVVATGSDEATAIDIPENARAFADLLELITPATETTGN